MRNRRERNMAELYDATERLAQPEITPILEGTCHIQGPVHEYDYELQSTDLCHFPVETDCLNASKHPYPRAESGTCNVCSSPCSLCFHFNRALPVMETNLDGPSVNIPSRKDDDNCSYAAASVVKSGAQDKQENTNIKTSHSPRSSSSLYSSVENAENKETFRSSGAHNTFDVVISPKVILDAVENNNFLQEQTSSTCGSPFSSDGIKPSEFSDEKASDTNDGKHSEMYHIESSLHIVESKDSNCGIRDHPAELDEKIVGCSSRSSSRSEDNSNFEHEEKAIQKDVFHAYINTEIAENQTHSKGNGFLLMKNNTTSESTDILCQNTDSLEGPNSLSNMPTKVQLPCSGSPRIASLSQCYVDDEISPTDGKLFVPSVDSENSNAYCEISKEDGAKSQLPLIFSETADESLGTKNDDSKVESRKAVKCSESNEEPTILNSNSQVPQVPVPLQPTNDGEISAEIEDDVKVCDICGDAGQEELLAICSRCSDGAEHIYCMRVMLDKVPEGDWLCEECQFKETDDEVIGKSEAQFEHETIDEPSTDENSQNVESTSKSLPGVENKAIDSDIRTETKEPINSISSKRRRESSEVNSASKEKSYKASGAPSGLTIPRNPVSDENIKLDFVNAKLNSPITISGHSDGISQSIGFMQTSTDGQLNTCTQTSNNADLSMIQTRAEARKGPLSKSVSFNNSKVPKVKQLLENVPQKQKSSREYNLSTTRNEGLFRSITKSSSFRNDGSSFRSAETISKVQALNSPKHENPRGLKPVKDWSTIEKKNSISDHRFGSSVLSTTSFSSLKADSKVQQYDARVKMNSDSSNLTDCRGSHDATSIANEVKKQPSTSLSRSGTTSFVRLPKNEDRKPLEPVVKAAEQKHRDEKIKDHSFSGSSRQATAINNQLLRCHRCNESGHATQFCAVEKFCMITTMPSSERNLKDKDNRTKWKVAFEGLKGKTGKKMNARPSDQSEEVSLSSTDANSEIASKDFASTSRNLTLIEGTEDVEDFSKATNTIHGNKKVEVAKKSLYLSRKDSTLEFADDLPTKPNIENFSDQDSILMHQLRASVIPELDYVWQGAFEVLSSAKPPSHFDGFQAHLSAHVSPNALEVAKQLPCKILLEEVPRLSSWPLQFHENSPKEDNIALFFFAKDNESYDNYYMKLLENMLTYDLALVGNIGAVELLIFHSNLLPENSRRWNKLLYLWGVFRRRQSNSLGDLPDLEKKSSVSLLKMKATMNDLSTPIDLPDISDEHTHYLSKTNEPIYSICTVNKGIPTSGNVVAVLNEDDEVLNNNISCSLPAVGFRNLSGATVIPVSHAKPKLQIDIEQLPSEMEIDLTCLDNLANNSDSTRDRGHVLPSSTTHSTCENTAISVLVNCWQGNEKNVKKMKKQHTEVDLDNQLSDKFDHLILEPKPTLEHAQAGSVEAIKCSSHLLQPTADTILWADESICTSLSDEKEHKRMRFDNGGRVDCKSREETLRSSLFSKIQSLPSSLISTMYHEAVPRSSKNEERHFFLNDFGPTSSTKANNLIHVLSSDDEDIHDSDAPDLELALGERRRLVKQDVFPILSSKNRDDNARDKLPGPAVDEGDDTLASLSLSLAIPASEKMKPAKPTSEAEQLLPDKPCISTSLLLFGGGYRDT